MDDEYDTYVCVCDVVCRCPMLIWVNVRFETSIKTVVSMLCDR